MPRSSKSSLSAGACVRKFVSGCGDGGAAVVWDEQMHGALDRRVSTRDVGHIVGDREVKVVRDREVDSINS